MSEVSLLLEAAAEGDRQAAAQLLPLVYAELRRLAEVRMAGQAPGQTLQATALVHEAYLKLVGVSDGQRWRGRQHFFAAAAEAMRHILVDRARRRAAQKRGGGKARRESAPLDQIAIKADKDSNDDNILAVDAALERFSATDRQAAELVKLRYFVGMTIADAAAALDISPRTADRLWVYARAWLRSAIDQA